MVLSEGKRVSIAYGDGIGPEVMESVLALWREMKLNIALQVVEVGGESYRKEWAYGISDSAWDMLKSTGVFLKSPTKTPRSGGHKSLNVALRQRFGLFANVRPCRSYEPFLHSSFPGIDAVIIRENSEDIYTGIEYRRGSDAYLTEKVITSTASRRICRYAFEYARLNFRKKVTCLVKDNIMKMTDGCFINCFREVASDYPNIIADNYILDIGVANVASKPGEFDVIVVPNLYGDVLSDLVSELSSSVGLSGSANLGGDFAMFEAVHGTAPDIAGLGIANPSGLINASVYLLSYIGMKKDASVLYTAWFSAIREGYHTADLYKYGLSKKKVGTAEFTDVVSNNIERVRAGDIELCDFNMDFCPKLLGEYSDKLGARVDSAKKKIGKVLIGADFIIDTDGAKNGLDFKLIKDIGRGCSLKLVLAHFNGLVLWPQSPLYACDAAYVCCRFYGDVGDDVLSLPDLQEVCISDAEVMSLFKALVGAGLSILSINKLFRYEDDQPGFTL